MSNTAVALSGLARRLVREGVLSDEAAQQAVQGAARQQTSLVAWLADEGGLPPMAVAEVAAEEFGTPLFDLATFQQQLAPRGMVDVKLIQRHHSLPLYQRGNRLFVAVSDPTNLRALDELKFHTGLNTEAILVDEGQLREAIARHVAASDSGLGEELDQPGLEELEFEAEPDEDEGQEAAPSEADETPIVRFVNKVLVDAIRGGASDIHFEPYEKNYRVRFRTDGILHEMARPPVALGSRLAARLKVMSRMDISERRMPQDGRIKMKLSPTRAIDFRVNTLPTLWGEKVVLRILDPSSAQMGIDQLGYEPEQKQLYLEALDQPQGMILVTGPTGSGKTVSLYTGINLLNTAERNISTAEDPVEINLEGINQVQINPRTGLDFAEALRSFLRQDPDVIMVGEIRDLETAEIAIKAAQTGHMVMSTLHTNSAAETISRLLNMGVAPFNLATSVNLIIAQRLARRLCSHCARPADIPPEALLAEGFDEALLDGAHIMEPVGCNHCNGGYRGRVGIYEVVRITDRIARLIMEQGNAIEIDDAARAEGFPDLRRSALVKCAAGITSLAEINRVTRD